MKRWSITPSAIINTTTCFLSCYVTITYTRNLQCIKWKYRKPLIQKLKIQEPVDTENRNTSNFQYMFSLCKSYYELKSHSMILGHGSCFLVWHVLQVLLFSHWVLVNSSLCFHWPLVWHCTCVVGACVIFCLEVAVRVTSFFCSTRVMSSYNLFSWVFFTDVAWVSLPHCHLAACLLIRFVCMSPTSSWISTLFSRERYFRRKISYPGTPCWIVAVLSLDIISCRVMKPSPPAVPRCSPQLNPVPNPVP